MADRGCTSCDHADWAYYCWHWLGVSFCKPPRWRFYSPRIERTRTTCKHGNECDCSALNKRSCWEPKCGASHG